MNGLALRGIPVVNPGLFPYRAPHLGNNEAPSNRLLDVRAGVVLSRGAQLFPDPRTQTGWGRRQRDDRRNIFPIPFDSWTEEEKAAVAAAADAPSAKELEDVTVVDEIFGFAPTNLTVDLRRVYDLYNLRYLGYLWRNVCTQAFIWGPIPKRGVDAPGVGNPFYCTNASPPLLLTSSVSWPSTYKYYGLDPNAPWGEQRQAFYNTQVLARTLRTYPFPRPIPVAPGFWYHDNRDVLAEVANSGLVITEPLARMMITAYTLESYERVAARIIDWAEERAEKKKRWQIIRMVGLIAVGVIWSIALAPVLSSIIPAGVPLTGAQVTSTITSFLQEQYTKEEMAKMAEEVRRSGGEALVQ